MSEKLTEALRQRLHPKIDFFVLTSYGTRAYVEGYLGKRSHRTNIIASTQSQLVEETARSMERNLLGSSRSSR